MKSNSESPIINRVAQSSLVTFDLEKLYHPGPRMQWDIRDQLYQGIILKEKEFRSFLNSHDWSNYKGYNVAITCSVDAIIPTWAYMLLAVNLNPYVNHLVFGDLKELELSLFQKALSEVDFNVYRDAKVIIKGCGSVPIPEFAYVEATRLLQNVASSVMYGEPCSTVPLFKKSRL
jgi:hypothetical protein